jgi:hypothetical protein
VDVVNDIDKLMVREKEAADIVYPFNVPGGQIRYDVANAFVRPEEDQLAGSCKNFYSVQGCVDISNGEYGLTWVTVDAPVVELGSITAEHPWLKSAQPSPLVSSYIMNNYWHTNYKADQSGPVRFRYSILPHAEFKSEAAARSEIECRQPLIAVAADPRIPPARTLFTLEPAGVIALSVKPADEGRARLLYLFNPTDTDQKVSVKTRGLIPAPLRPSDPSGRILGERVSRFDVAAHGSGYVLVEGK